MRIGEGGGDEAIVGRWFPEELLWEPRRVSAGRIGPHPLPLKDSVVAVRCNDFLGGAPQFFQELCRELSNMLDPVWCVLTDGGLVHVRWYRMQEGQ